ncbi:MAG: hypothetical protein IPJ85_12975 [Flavobacteriales bacterium]|nr:hypothetical protein [Flavobacteriales bacterium]
MRFLRDKRQLSIIKKDEGLGKAPFYNTYHQVDMYFEVITWKQGDPVVQLGNPQRHQSEQGQLRELQLLPRQALHGHARHR